MWSLQSRGKGHGSSNDILLILDCIVAFKIYLSWTEGGVQKLTHMKVMSISFKETLLGWLDQDNKEKLIPHLRQ